MKLKKILILPAVLLLMLACVIPGTSSTPASSAPTFDSAPLNTMVAETVSAALMLTEQAKPAATLTPTITPTPQIDESANSNLIKQPESSTLFVDDRAGYTVLIPPGWLPVRLNQQEYFDAFSLPEVLASERYQQSLLSIQNQDPSLLRLLAIDVQVAHLQKEFISNLVFTLDQSVVISLDSDESVQALADSIENANPKEKIESAKIITLSDGMTMGVVEFTTRIQTASGESATMYQKQIVFPLKNGTQSIVLTTLNGLKDEILPVFDAMLDTVALEE